MSYELAHVSSDFDRGSVPALERVCAIEHRGHDGPCVPVTTLPSEALPATVATYVESRLERRLEPLQTSADWVAGRCGVFDGETTCDLERGHDVAARPHRFRDPGGSARFVQKDDFGREVGRGGGAWTYVHADMPAVGGARVGLACGDERADLRYWAVPVELWSPGLTEDLRRLRGEAHERADGMVTCPDCRAKLGLVVPFDFKRVDGGPKTADQIRAEREPRMLHITELPPDEPVLDHAGELCAFVYAHHKSPCRLPDPPVNPETGQPYTLFELDVLHAAVGLGAEWQTSERRAEVAAEVKVRDLGEFIRRPKPPELARFGKVTVPRDLLGLPPGRTIDTVARMLAANESAVAELTEQIQAELFAEHLSGLQAAIERACRALCARATERTVAP